MEGRMNVVEYQLEAFEIIVEGVKAKTAALRQNSTTMRHNLQEIMRMLGGRARNAEHHQSDGNQASFNENRRRWEEEKGDEWRTNSIGGRGLSYPFFRGPIH